MGRAWHPQEHVSLREKLVDKRRKHGLNVCSSLCRAGLYAQNSDRRARAASAEKDLDGATKPLWVGVESPQWDEPVTAW